MSSADIIYTLASSDAQEFKISDKALRQSKTLSDLVLNMNPDSTAEQADAMGAIPVSNVAAPALKLVIEWCEKHQDDVTPQYDDEDEQPARGLTIPEWDAEWMKPIEGEALFDLICAANFLNVTLLLNYTCKMVADMAKGKNPEELRAIYGILTDEEEREKERKKKEGVVEVKEEKENTVVAVSEAETTS